MFLDMPFFLTPFEIKRFLHSDIVKLFLLKYCLKACTKHSNISLSPMKSFREGIENKSESNTQSGTEGV